MTNYVACKYGNTKKLFFVLYLDKTAPICKPVHELRAFFHGDIMREAEDEAADTFVCIDVTLPKTG